MEEYEITATRVDVYVAEPPAMMPDVVAAPENTGIDHERIHVDSFGL